MSPVLKTLIIVVGLGIMAASYLHGNINKTGHFVCVHYDVEATDFPDVNIATCDRWEDIK